MMARTGGFRGVVPPDNIAGKRENGPPLGGPLSSVSRLVATKIGQTVSSTPEMSVSRT
jgi:hypothetical protein